MNGFFAKVLGVLFLSISISCSLPGGKDNLLTFEGTVFSSDDKPISDVLLKIADRHVEVMENGYFCFEWLLPMAGLELTVDAPGYDSIVLPIQYGQLYIDIKLSPLDSGNSSYAETKPLPRKISDGFYCTGN